MREPPPWYFPATTWWPMLEVGETVGQYRVEALLALGGVSAVYRVRDTRAGTIHQLKLLVGTSAFDRDRVLEEGRIQARLRHPNLVGVIDVLRIGDDPALVMEPVEGPTLDLWLAEGRISVDIALAVFRGIVTGIGVAHAVGLVHRAIKPSSVWLGRGRSGAMVSKVTDFGLPGVGVRASAYLAPEQLRDARVTDVRSDLWALGCVLYELVCGVPAFSGVDPVKLRDAVTTARYPDPRALLAPRSPSRVTDVIRDLLSPDPDERIQSCSLLWSRLWDVAVPRELSAEVTQPIEEESAPDLEPTHVWEGLDEDELREGLEATADGQEATIRGLERPITLVPPEEPARPSPAPVQDPAPLSTSATRPTDPGPAGGPEPVDKRWSRTPCRSVSSRPRGAVPPPPPAASGLWYLGALTATAVPTGLLVLLVGALLVHRSGTGWIEDWLRSVFGA